MKRIIKLFLTALLAGTVLFQVACGSGEKDIFVVAREAGSGTRGAFEEIIGLEAGLAYGSEENSTGSVITKVETNKDAIGYISLGSLSDKVKALKVGGVDATAAKVASGDYKIARPFLIVNKDITGNALALDFKKFLTSSQAQTIIEAEKYVSVVNNAASYVAPATAPAGTIAISGSTSVTPLMEKLVAKYKDLNSITSNTTITITGNGSGDGIKEAKAGTSTFGMSSRELKDSEKPDFSGDTGATLELCKDGIAVIVHKDNEISDLTLDQVKKIYKSEIKKFSELSK